MSRYNHDIELLESILNTIAEAAFCYKSVDYANYRQSLFSTVKTIREESESGKRDIFGDQEYYSFNDTIGSMAVRASSIFHYLEPSKIKQSSGEDFLLGKERPNKFDLKKIEVCKDILSHCVNNFWKKACNWKEDNPYKNEKYAIFECFKEEENRVSGLIDHFESTYLKELAKSIKKAIHILLRIGISITVLDDYRLAIMKKRLGILDTAVATNVATKIEPVNTTKDEKMFHLFDSVQLNRIFKNAIQGQRSIIEKENPKFIDLLPILVSLYSACFLDIDMPEEPLEMPSFSDTNIPKEPLEINCILQVEGQRLHIKLLRLAKTLGLGDNNIDEIQLLLTNEINKSNALDREQNTSQIMLFIMEAIEEIKNNICESIDQLYSEFYLTDQDTYILLKYVNQSYQEVISNLTQEQQKDPIYEYISSIAIKEIYLNDEDEQPYIKPFSETTLTNFLYYIYLKISDNETRVPNQIHSEVDWFNISTLKNLEKIEQDVRTRHFYKYIEWSIKLMNNAIEDFITKIAQVNQKASSNKNLSTYSISSRKKGVEQSFKQKRFIINSSYTENSYIEPESAYEPM